MAWSMVISYYFQSLVLSFSKSPWSVPSFCVFKLHCSYLNGSKKLFKSLGKFCIIVEMSCLNSSKKLGVCLEMSSETVFKIQFLKSVF